MTEKEIKIYLEAFWKGESTQEQETALKTYFANDKIPSSFDQDRPYFEYIHQEQKKELTNPSFDEQVLSEVKQVKIRQLWYKAIKIAAGIAIFGGVAWWYHTHQAEIPNAAADLKEKSIPSLLHKSDSQRSQELAKDALILLSKGLNKDTLTHESYLKQFKLHLQDFPKDQPATDILP